MVNLNEYICHGIPNRCFKINGKHMPICARCTGAGIGHIIAFIAFAMQYKVAYYWIAVLPIIMLADWVLQNKIHAYNSNLSRLITGICGGLGVGILFWDIISWI